MTKDEALRLAVAALKHGGCPPDCKDGMTDSGGVHPWGEAALIPCPNCKTIAACEKALAQPEPEIVAIGYMNAGHVHEMQQGRLPHGYVYPKGSVGADVAVYTSPPKRKPLTDGQLEKGLAQTFSINNPFCPCDSKTFRKVARWVEAAHGIKE